MYVEIDFLKYMGKCNIQTCACVGKWEEVAYYQEIERSCICELRVWNFVPFLRFTIIFANCSDNVILFSVYCSMNDVFAGNAYITCLNVHV